MLHVKSAKYLSGFKLWVAFDDGTAGEVDLDGVLKGPVFDSLQDVNMFKRFAVDPELATLVWYNGADLAPEFLKAHCSHIPGDSIGELLTMAGAEDIAFEPPKLEGSFFQDPRS
jgi:hypothetical protein